MPELPEVEIIARLLDKAVAGAVVESVRVLGVSTLRSFDPPISSIEGHSIASVGRRGKHLLVEFDSGLHLLVHLMSAGRLQIFDKLASLKDRTSRVLVRLEDARELRLREFGTRQSAWAKLLTRESLAGEESISTLGPEAWPNPPPLEKLLDEPRPLHTLLRDQRVMAGIGRSWVDEILHGAMLSPFKRGSDLSKKEASELRRVTIKVLGRAIAHYEQVIKLPIPDSLPMPLTVHKHQGEPCARCGTKIEAVHYEDHVMCYCPACQTGGKLLKDRRLSRLLK